MSTLCLLLCCTGLSLSVKVHFFALATGQKYSIRAPSCLPQCKNTIFSRVSLIILLFIYEIYISTERATLLCCANFPFLSYRNCVPISSFAVRVTTSKELANSHSDPSASPRKPKEEVVTVFKSSKFDSLEV